MGGTVCRTGVQGVQERTSTHPLEWPHKSRRRELWTIGTLRSRITPMEKSRARVDQKLATSPRLCGKEALRLELASHRKEARSSFTPHSNLSIWPILIISAHIFYFVILGFVLAHLPSCLEQQNLKNMQCF